MISNFLLIQQITLFSGTKLLGNSMLKIRIHFMIKMKIITFKLNKNNKKRKDP